VQIPWSALAQVGFGKAVPFDASQILTVQWNFPEPSSPPTASFDLRIDDVAFLPSSSSCSAGQPGFVCQSDADCCSGACLAMPGGLSTCQ
jgi:hypothetical protein